MNTALTLFLLVLGAISAVLGTLFDHRLTDDSDAKKLSISGYAFIGLTMLSLIAAGSISIRNQNEAESMMAEIAAIREETRMDTLADDMENNVISVQSAVIACMQSVERAYDQAQDFCGSKTFPNVSSFYEEVVEDFERTVETAKNIAIEVDRSQLN